MPDKLYALYMQATRSVAGTNSRKQWIVVPPAPVDLADRAKLPAAHRQFVLAHRHQIRTEDRTTWKFERHDAESFDMLFANVVRSVRLEYENLEPKLQWQISPMITAQMTVDEVLDMHRTPKTPWPVLKRFERVARKAHGISI